MLGWQRNGSGSAAFHADLATGKTTQWVGHNGPSGLNVPLKNVVRAEVEALQIRAAGAGVNDGEPGEFLTQVIKQRHIDNLQSLHE